jgi:hypothetical protein
LRKTILYIISDSRSGSTLLENILSNSSENISVGELHHLDSHLNKGVWGKTWGWNCSCGKSFSDCEFWKKVFTDLNERGINNGEKTSIIYRKSVHKFLPKFASSYDTEQNTKTIAYIGEIYNSVFNTTSCKIIIDSSKNPLQGLALYKNLDFDVRVIYLKRDLRSLVISKQKWHKKFSGINSNKYKILLACVLFRLRSKSCLKKIAKEDKINISYEELSKDTERVVFRILDKYKISKFEIPKYTFFGDNHHTVGGSPNRFKKKEIKYDSKWEAKIIKTSFFNFVAKALNKI